MRCPSSQLINEYFAGQCDAQQQQAISLHIAECARCRQEVQAIQRLADVLEALPLPQIPGDLWAGVVARIDARPRRGILPRLWQTFAGIGIAASLISGILMMNRPQTSLPSPSGVSASYVSRHRLLSARDPLADRANIGVMLAADQGSH